MAFCGDDFYTVHASVDGAIDGDSFEVTAYWDNGTTGLYTGKVGSRGRVEGTTYDKQHPQTMAHWYTDRTAPCLPSSSGTSARGATPPAQEGTVKAQGRVKTGKVSPKISICEAAEKARLRNSPAAPGLAAQCAAAMNAASDTAGAGPVDTAGKGNPVPPKDEACTWYGEAPFCGESSCPSGAKRMAAESNMEAEFARSHPDFGLSCASGFKVYCCRQ